MKLLYIFWRPRSALHCLYKERGEIVHPKMVTPVFLFLHLKGAPRFYIKRWLLLPYPGAGFYSLNNHYPASLPIQ